MLAFYCHTDQLVCLIIALFVVVYFPSLLLINAGYCLGVVAPHIRVIFIYFL